MAEHHEKVPDDAAAPTDEPEQPAASASEPPRRRGARRRPNGNGGSGLRQIWGRIVNVVARVVIIIAMIAAVVLALHIVFAVFKTNPGNAIVSFVNDWSATLAWEFRDMFAFSNDPLNVLVNYGLAGVIYLVAGQVVAALIRRLG